MAEPNDVSDFDIDEYSDEQDDDTISFDFIKSKWFRVVHADGAYGGMTPRGDIHMALYNERSPIPKRVTHRLLPDGGIGAEIREKRDEREAVVREVEVDVVLSLEVAKSLHQWLGGKIRFLERVIAESESQIGSKGEDLNGSKNV